MGVLCYVDPLSLLCLSFKVLKKCKKTCELYANEHKILFNAKQSQVLHFTYPLQLIMNDGSIIPDVDTCNYLGNTISTKSDKKILHNEIYMRNNCLLFYFFLFSVCITLSHLFDTYCMNVYASPLWKYYDINYDIYRNHVMLNGENHCVEFWKISNVAPSNLLSFIHNCHHIDSF